MTKRTQPPDPRRRHLSREDEALWQETAATLKPIGKARPRARVSPEGPPAEDTAPKHSTKSEKIPAPAPFAGRKSGQPQGKPEVPALDLFDRKAARRLRQGRIEIEARVDLHGLRQNEAHARLRRFLISCHTQGLRWVLVITGKGAARRERDDGDGNFSAAMGGEERGVLKRNVPMWLAEPDMRAIIVSFTAAAAQHGGEGALYVRLRSPERSKGRVNDSR